MQNDKKNGIAFGTERGPITEEVKQRYKALQEKHAADELKKKEHLDWINQHWKVVEGSTVGRTGKIAYCESSDGRYKTTIEVSVEIDSNGFKSLVVDVDKEETTPHGSWTTADIPVEILEQLLK